jgi:hypothetical protein
MRVDDLIMQLCDTAELALFPDQAKLLLISINETVGNPKLTLYDAVRYSWHVSQSRARGAEHVLAVAHGLIVGVFEAEEWLAAEKKNFWDLSDEHGNWSNQEGRSGFRGHEAQGDIQRLYRGKRVPTEHSPGQNPIHYVNC